MRRYIEKADVLIEALPYIQKFDGAVVVVKFGGSVMEDDELIRGALRDIVFMEAVGMKPVVVHGGGKAITKRLEEESIPVRFVSGLRYTCQETLKIVDDVLHNDINAKIAETVGAHGGDPARLSGKDFLKASKTMAKDHKTGEEVDVGFVGDVHHVDPAPILEALAAGAIPIVAPLAKGDDGQIYNVNADIAACKVAEDIHARKLVFVSDVPGILEDPKDEESLISTIRLDEVDGLIRRGVIKGGMLPKIESAVRALKAGTAKVHFVDGRLKHSLLLEIFTDKGVGTEITR